MVQRLGCLCLLAIVEIAAAAQAQENNLAELDLATLMTMDVTITSAAKHAQASSDAAAAVYVITRDDIRRSGATNLPELLRYVPGVQVARIDTRGWSVTARGSGSRFANKLLVMIDGRSIYTTIFSGIIWEEQSPLLDNIERIEVVRGPGGALWGINAVNGVINIITRNASDTRGVFLEANAGDDEAGAAIRYGGAGEAVGDYRVHLNHDATDALDGQDSDVERTSAGWRVDRPMFGGELTFEGELSSDDFSDFDNLPQSAYHRYAKGGNVLLDWERGLGAGQLELRGFYSRLSREHPGEWNEATIGAEAQFSAKRIGRHLLTVGAAFRRMEDEQFGLIPELRLLEESCGHEQWNVYAQDEIRLLDDAAQLTLGAKLEDFELTGIAFQPTVRGLWKLTERHTLWAAASRAARTPSRFELHSNVSSLVTSTPFPVYLSLSGDPELDFETLTAYELGWRWRPLESLSVDLALYHNEYRDLIAARELEPQFVFTPFPQLVLPIRYSNDLEAQTRGAELALEWQAASRLRLQAGAAWFDVDASAVGANLTSATGMIDPERSYTLRMRLDPMSDVEVDFGWRYVSTLPGIDVDSYDALDARVAWTPVKSLELSVTVDNLLGGRHAEFRDAPSDGRIAPHAVEFERSFVARFVWRPSL